MDQSLRQITVEISNSGNNAKTDIVEFLERDPEFRKYLSAKTSFQSGHSPLHMASFQNAPDIIELLIKDYNLHVNSTITVGLDFSATPLHIAIRSGRMKSGEMLLKCGADPSLGGHFSSDSKFVSALQLAEQTGYREIINLLKKWKFGEAP